MFNYTAHVGLDLLEQEKRWAFMQQGRMHDYHGIAVHPRHLSLWEKWVLGLHKDYRPNAQFEGTSAETTMQVQVQLRLQHCIFV